MAMHDVSGMAQAFAFGIYSPSVGFTLRFENNAKQLVALSGIFLGAGEMICKNTIYIVLSIMSVNNS